ncbi:MAG: LytTR family DNA-binding domain-containing protein [Bacteroidota bacterium]|nr:LytTR family DNA-binding domain-containing protein [Bacteroidota bacterium]
MKKISTILIDDESANLKVLASLLRRHCPQVEICGLASSAEEGFEVINLLRPSLIFLDIRMPNQSGFDLLRMFDCINFHVIFVSAFDEYAINAFEFSAIDYILKPIDHTKLTAAVERAVQKINSLDNDNMIHFIKTLEEKSSLIRNISLHKNGKVNLINLDEVSYIEAARGYSEVVTESGCKFISAKSLTEYEMMLSGHKNFIRVNKSFIINADHLQEYTKGETCFITLKNQHAEIEVSRRKKTSIIHFLKSSQIF